MHSVNPRDGRSAHSWRRGGRGACACALALAAAVGCSKGSGTKPPLTVSPSEVSLVAGGPSQQFTAQFPGEEPLAAAGWSIETAGSAEEVGTVVAGLYTPPATRTADADVVVRATFGDSVGSAIVHLRKNADVPEEPVPEPDPVTTTVAPIAIEVIDATTGSPIPADYHWVIEENAMRGVVPGMPAVAGESPSLSLHPSYMPVVASGVGPYTTNPAHAVTLDPAKRYFVSILPRSGYQMGGAQVPPGATSVRIVVQPLPVPTAQITIFAFEDTFPINNAPDLPAERGLGGFTVFVAEGGGTYGASGGQVMQDAFGKPIGTEYQRDANGAFVLDADQKPIVQTMGSGVVRTDANGLATIKYLAPGKYGIQLIPPAGEGWQQTTTIEGTKTVDAWVKSGEPPFLQEFGALAHHVFMGFVKPFRHAALTGGVTLTGQIVGVHVSRPPELRVFDGGPLENCWVGLNDLAGSGQGLFAGPCSADPMTPGTFAIPGVPPGFYQLVVWDEFLDLIVAFSTVRVSASDSGTMDLGTIPVNQWFAQLEGKVCLENGEPNGFCDPGEVGIPDQAVNLRFRDGSIYQATATDLTGAYAFPEIFPFFNWLTVEVDFLRYKATGATIAVDDGGAIPPSDGWAMPAFGKLTPQPQYEVDPVTGFATSTPAVNPTPGTGTAFSRTETGPVLVQGFQAFAGLTSVIDWGKALYGADENGGISGIVHYASTRAEDDPRYAAADNWEPKIPRVQVVLYRDHDGDGKIDAPEYATSTLSSAGYVGLLADVDNWPFGWSDPACDRSVAGHTCDRGPEDVKRVTARGDAATFDQGDAYDVTWTDAWDDSPPQGCQYGTVGPYRDDAGTPVDCFEGLYAFQQVRPAVFDGGYAFGGAAGKAELPIGAWVVEAVTPPGYEHVKEEDKNVTVGDAYVPSPLLLPPPCVGQRRRVPSQLTLSPDEAPALAGQVTHLCDRKQVEVKPGQNAAADFFMFTTAPVSAHIVAMVTDDLNNGTNPRSPSFGEKLTMGHIPIAVHDWNGVEIARTYTDQWGIAQLLVPSTFTANAPMPSGYAPNMLRICINSPGWLDAGGAWVDDPWFDRTHSHTCYTFQFMPGKTTYLDTPVVPGSAFATQPQQPVDCEAQAGVPVIWSVEGLDQSETVSYGGPRVPVPGTPNPRVRITSLGARPVPNPAWDGTLATSATILRDHGFGPEQGTVTLDGAALPIVRWSAQEIVARVPPGSATGQLEVQRANGAWTVEGVTLTVADSGVHLVPAGGSIQAVIDAPSTQPGDTVLVPPGVYRQLLFLHKPVRLQGSGALSTRIDGLQTLAGELAAWRARLASLAGTGFDLLPGQVAGPSLLALEEGPAILVAGNANEFTAAAAARIDGFTITGASSGGAILVNGHAAHLRISNNRIVANSGTFAGGIRVGHPNLVAGGAYVDAQNDFVTISNNHVALNGGASGVAGGIAICTGAERYVVEENHVCGNFSNGDGGGIAHVGTSDGGTIRGNTIRYNQAYQQGQIAQGGGVFVGGLPPLGAGQLSAGTGDVTISGNVIQGNFAATGDGGGIRLEFVNGEDVRGAPATWSQIVVENNVVVNNVAGNAGGGISLQDVVRARIVNNTVANNDSTGTSIAAFAAGGPNLSAPQPAGIVSWAHGNALAALVPGEAPFANPVLENNVVWHNRSFYWTADVATQTQGLVSNPAGQGIWDLAVLGAGATAQLDPQYCVLTDATGYAATNVAPPAGAPLFEREYVNGDRALSVLTPDVPSTMTTYAAFDEGGNFLSVEYGPLTPIRPTDGLPYGDYHLRAGSAALGVGRSGAGIPTTDIDLQPRPSPAGSAPDAGADERG